MLAALCFGLREDSRIVMQISGSRRSFEQMALAAAVDRLSILVWQQTKGGHSGTNKPKLLMEQILGIKKETGFASGEDFERARAAILEKVK